MLQQIHCALPKLTQGVVSSQQKQIQVAMEAQLYQIH